MTDEWDAFVSEHPDGSPFLTTAWMDVVRDSYGVEPTLLTARDGETLTGVLPTYLFKSRIFGTRMVTAPFTSWGSLCAADEAAERELLAGAAEAGRRAGASYLELRGLRPHTLAELQPSRTRWVDFFLEIDEPERLWTAALEGRARTAVRKARKSGVEVRRGHELLDPFCEVMAISMRNLGTPVHSRAFFANILRCLGERAELLVAFLEGRAVAVYLVVRDGRRMYHWTGGSRPGFQRVNANSLLMWSALELAHEVGVAEFDFGRSAATAGTARFKEQWGAERVELHYEYLLYSSATLPDVTPANPRYRAAIATWKRLPVTLTRWLGPILMRSIP